MKYNRKLYPHWGKSPTSGFKDVRQYMIFKSVVSDLEIIDGVVTKGIWYCAYTGSLYNLEEVTPDLDHILPLKFIHMKGGSSAEPEQRQLIANDPINLIPVHPSSNRKKSWKAGEWLPVNGGYVGKYLESIKEISDKYDWLEFTQEDIDLFGGVKEKQHEIRNGFFITKQKKWFEGLLK